MGEIITLRLSLNLDFQPNASYHCFMTYDLTLDMLKTMQIAEVAKISAGPVLKKHLMELGFVEGSPIQFLMSTPFGDPNIYSLRGTSIALRKSEAKCIHVTV